MFDITLELDKDWKPNLSYQALAGVIGEVAPSAQQVFDTVCSLRREKLPDPNDLGNAGSFFKNPIVSDEKYAALSNAIDKSPKSIVFPNVGIFVN